MAVTDSGWAVEASGVTKRFGSSTAVDEVDLRVRAGTVHGLAGPNGAGKTTLLRMLFGLVRPTSGTLRLFGHTHGASWSAGGNHALDGVAGFVESPRFYGYLTGYRSLEMLAAYDGTASATGINAALERVGLSGRAHEKTAHYSLGMRQRLGIAAALLRGPRLLILDEPANGLDPAGARDMRTLIRELAGAGLTVLMSSHVMSDVEMLCEEVTILRAGKVAFSGPVEDLRVQAPAPSYRLDTSDNATAAMLAPASATVVTHSDGGLVVDAHRRDLDGFVIALGRAGVAVRSLSLDTTPLEALFFALTDSRAPDPADDSQPQLVQAAR